MSSKKTPAEKNKEDFISKLKEDIEKTGFSSEMKVNKILINNNLQSIKPAQTYLDKDSNLSREIDFVVYHSIDDVDFNVVIVLCLIIEVKKSSDPWVIFYKESDIPHHFIPSYDRCNYHINEVENPPSRYLIKDLHKYKSPLVNSRILGTAFHEAFKKKENNSQIYGGLMSCIKAAIHERELNKSEPKEAYQPSEVTVVQYFLPIVVLEGSLYKASLDEVGNTLIEEISYIPISLSYSSTNYVKVGAETYYPEIVTLEGLDKYLKDIIAWQDEVLLYGLELKKKAIPPAPRFN